MPQTTQPTSSKHTDKKLGEFNVAIQKEAEERKKRREQPIATDSQPPTTGQSSKSTTAAASRTPVNGSEISVVQNQAPTVAERINQFEGKGKSKESDETPPSSTIEPDLHEDFDKPIPVSGTQKGLRFLTLAGVLVDSLYSGFLWTTITSSVDDVFQNFGQKVPAEIKDYIRYIAIPFVVANLIYDMTAIDPKREADELAFSFRQEATKNKKLIQKIILTYTPMMLQMIGSYLVGAGADALPVADIANDPDFHWDKTISASLRYGGLALTASTVSFYYLMFTNPKIKRHVTEFIAAMKNPGEFFSNLGKHPAAYLEVLIQSSINAIYRSISFAFLAQDIATDVFLFTLPKRLTFSSSPGIFTASTATAVSTGIISLFSRTLSSRDQFANPNFELLTPEERQNASGWCKKFILDVFQSLIRGGAVGVIIEEVLSAHNPLRPILPLSYTTYGDYALSGIAAALVTYHAGRVRYQARRDQNALTKISENVLKARQKQRDVSTKDIKVSEEAPLLSNQDKDTQLDVQPSDEQKELQLIEELRKDYDKIVAKQGSTAIDNTAGAVVFMTQVLRFVAFYLFINTIDSIYELELNPVVVTALALLLGTGVALNDAAVYQASLVETWQNYKARYKLESKLEEKQQGNAEGQLESKPEEKQQSNTEGQQKVKLSSSYLGIFYRALKVPFKSPYDYAPSLVKEVANKVEKKVAVVEDTSEEAKDYSPS